MFFRKKSKKKETAPDGSKDENVFDIQQGVAITFFVKTSQKNSQSLGEVYYADLYGLRTEKYEFLNSHSVGDIKYQKANPTLENMYRFDIQDESLRSEWEKMSSVEEIFRLNGVGLRTHKDFLAYQSSENQIRLVIDDFLKLSEEELRGKYNLGDDSRDWKVARAKANVMSYGDEAHLFRQTLTKPFDSKWTYYTPDSRGFLGYPTYKVLCHMLLQDNVALITSRHGGEAEKSVWSTAFITDALVDLNIFRRGGGNVFPMYQIADDGTKFENITDEFFGELEKATGLKHHALDDASDVADTEFTTLDIMDYIYAILYAPSYRTKYKALLDSEFPRIPLPKNKTQFKALVDLGRQLRELHLSKQEGSFDSDVTYPEIGDNVVSQYKFKDDCVYINKSQYFGNIPKKAWEFFIGGYQPLEKWLKDRKGQVLSFDEITHYQYMVYAISKTIDLMSQIDQIVEF